MARSPTTRSRKSPTKRKRSPSASPKQYAKRAARLKVIKSPKGTWAKSQPRTVGEKRALYDRCGDVCFLAPNRDDPGNSRFPICPKLRTTGGKCAIDRRGFRAAKVRAHQYENKYPGVVKKIEEVEAIKSKLQEKIPRSPKKSSPKKKKTSPRKSPRTRKSSSGTKKRQSGHKRK